MNDSSNLNNINGLSHKIHYNIQQCLFVLASRSPRRRELLEEAGYSFLIYPGDDKEDPIRVMETPESYTERLAAEKAQNSALLLLQNSDQFKNSPNETVILGCDSIAVCQGEILGKPEDRNDARRMLHLLSDTVHCVHSGLCLIYLDRSKILSTFSANSDFDPADLLERLLTDEPTLTAENVNRLRPIRQISTVETSHLKMDPLTEEQIESYLDSGKWQGKAGAFGYQDGNDWLHLIQGSAANVVGLPLERLSSLLDQLLESSTIFPIGTSPLKFNKNALGE